MTIPVHGIGVPATYLCVNRIARKTMLPKPGCEDRLEVGLIPYISSQVAPFFHKGVKICFINSKTFGVGLWYELWLTGYGPYVFGILGLSKSHVVVATYGIAEGLVVDVCGNVEIHRTAYILND
jgi:hypothetical protein